MTIQEVFSFLNIDITTDKDVICEAYQQRKLTDNVKFDNSSEEFLEKIYAAAIFYADSAALSKSEPCDISLEDFAPTQADFAIWDARQAQYLEEGYFQAVISVFYEIQPFFPEAPSIYERTAQALLLHSVPDYWVRDFVSAAEENGINSNRITILQLRCMRLKIENGEVPGEDSDESNPVLNGALADGGESVPSPHQAAPDTLEDILCYAQVLLLEQQEDEASPELCSALMAELAFLYMDLDRFPEALEYCLDSIELMPIYAHISNYGYICVEEQRKKGCQRHFYNVKNMNGIYDWYASYCMSLAKFYRVNNCLKEARAYYRRVIQDYPTDGTIYGDIGEICYQMMQKFDDPWDQIDALYYLNHQIKKCFVKVPSYLIRGKVFLLQKAYANAHKDADAVIASKNEEKLLPEAMLLKAKIILAECPDGGRKAVYYLEKAYDLCSKIMDQLSANHWVDTISAKLAKENCQISFSYWNGLLDSIAEIYRQILLCTEIISLGERLEQENGNAQKADNWRDRRKKQLRTSGDICETLNSRFIALCADTAPCTERLLYRAPGYALRRLDPKARELIESLM